MKKPKPIWIQGINRTAEAITSKFGTTCSRQDIQHWKGFDPPFPAPRANNQFNQAECFEWFEKHIKPTRLSGKSDVERDLFVRAKEAEAKTIISKEEKTKLELDVQKGIYIERAKANTTAAKAIMTVKEFTVEEVESASPLARRDKLTSLGASPEMVAAFLDWDIKNSQAVIDRICQRCAAASKAAHV